MHKVSYTNQSFDHDDDKEAHIKSKSTIPLQIIEHDQTNHDKNSNKKKKEKSKNNVSVFQLVNVHLLILMTNK